MNNHQHNHSNTQTHENAHSSDKNILVAFLLNFVFAIFEIFGGIYTKSYAILSDAIHDSGDCIALGLAYILEKISKKDPSEKYTYGYQRYSIVSAIITSLILLAGGSGVISGAISRLESPAVIDGVGMFIFSSIGMVVNLIAALKTSKGKGINEKAITLHLLEDVLGWGTVLVTSFFVYFLEWYFMDTVLSICVAVVLLYHAAKRLFEAFKILLESTPKNFDVAGYKAALHKIDGVENIHHLHLWSLDGENVLATLHVKIIESATIEDYKNITKEIRKKSDLCGIEHLTIQIDFDDDPHTEHCGI